MVRLNEVRRNEVAIDAPKSFDAGLTFIGLVRTPWTSRLDCPRQGRADGPVCRIEVFEPWVAALDGIETREGPVLKVRGLDCLDMTPLIDLKPDRCLFTPLAPPQKGDFET